MLKRIKDLREDSDLTQTELCSKINLKQQAYSLYENGKRDIPLTVLISLAFFYETSIDYIVGLTDDKRPYKRRK